MVSQRAKPIERSNQPLQQSRDTVIAPLVVAFFLVLIMIMILILIISIIIAVVKLSISEIVRWTLIIWRLSSSLLALLLFEYHAGVTGRTEGTIGGAWEGGQR